MRHAVRFVAFVCVLGCRAGNEPVPEDLVKLTPSSVSSDEVWALFDRDTTTGFVPSSEPIEVAFDRDRSFAAFRNGWIEGQPQPTAFGATFGQFAQELEEAAVGGGGLAGSFLAPKTFMPRPTWVPGKPVLKPDIVYRAPRLAVSNVSNPNAAKTVGEHVLDAEHLEGSLFESWTSDIKVAQEFARRRGTQIQSFRPKYYTEGPYRCGFEDGSRKAGRCCSRGQSALLRLSLAQPV
jgi:hypothetical protein